MVNIFFTSSMMTNNLMGKESWRMSFVDNWLSKKIDKKLTFLTMFGVFIVFS